MRELQISFANATGELELLDASHSTDLTAPRPLRREEYDLIVSLLRTTHSLTSASVPVETQVKDMQDGGQGGIRFVRPDPRRFGREVARGEYLDSDGVLVSITLNEDDHGDLFELDFWNVDFSSLKRYPTPQDVVVTD